MTVTTSAIEGVKAALVESLGIGDRIASVDADTPLFGSMPELDSLALLDLVAGLEERFDIVVDDSEFTGDIFETVGSLTSFVEEKTGGGHE